MKTFTYELLDTETDEVVMTLTCKAQDFNEACAVAEDEADFQGFFLGTVKETGQ